MNKPSRRCRNGSDGNEQCRNDAQLRIDDQGALADDVRDCAPPEAGCSRALYPTGPVLLSGP
jgi:hypothetical protein